MASGLLGSLIGSFGFRTTFEVTFEKISSPPGQDPDSGPLVVVPLPTIVPITRSFFETDVEVRMTSAGTANTFTVTIYGLGNDVFSLLDPQKTVVHLSLGYADGESSEVMTGLLTEKNLKTGDCWYEATLAGVDFVFDQLQNPRKCINTKDKPYQNQSVGDIAKDICKRAGVAPNIKVTGPTLSSQAFDNVTPLQALQKLAKIGGFSLQGKDGKLWMGSPSDLGTDQFTPITDGATSRPLTARGATPCSAKVNTLDGQDFEVAGNPALRPYDRVKFGSDRYQIESITHHLSRDGGYKCKGRALAPDASHEDLQAAGRPSPAQVARQLQQNLDGREQRRPAVSAGEVNDYTAGQHTTTLNIGTAPTPEMVNPTVQAPLRSDPVALPDKPMASPFAFHKVGLVVPVYKKMRTLLVHGWHEPDDAVVDGFLWTSQMTPPPNQPGDWWLCLPTQFDADGLPTGPTTDDLITNDGQRVIAVKGMKITIGAGLMNSAGSRPSPGSDESLTIETDQGAKITLKGAQIKLTDGSVTMTIGNGKVSIG